jgi:hypothetical protein
MSDTNHDDREHRIRVRAFEIWEAEGRPVGRADEHWQAALVEIEAIDAGEPETETKPTPTAQVAKPTPAEEPKPKKSPSKAA